MYNADQDKKDNVRIAGSRRAPGAGTWDEPSVRNDTFGTTDTELPHRGGGVEAILFQSGNIAMVYNNHENKARDRLAISISDDQGKTWKWTRQLEDEPGGRFDYPSIVQAAEGTIHVTYSYHLRTIKHAEFNEEWVKAEQGG